ncbi:MAG TPA: peptide chain release factor 1, partial [Thermoplasmatales archaeon]|nr:peptide chain release factor 1 [Thermoplasmatales archaeon]
MLDKRQKYLFKKKLDELRKIKGQHTELISLYIPPNRRISDVMAHLRDEYSQSSNIKSKQTRKNVLAAIESIMARLRYFKQPPPNGMVFFVGMVGEPPKLVAEVIEPPMPINIYLYRCDSQFYLEPLEKLIEEKDVYGLLLIDRRECTIGFLTGSRIEMAAYLTSRVPGKHKKGGQSQRRFERLTEIAAHEWFVKAGEKASKLFLEKENLKGILVGGPGATKREFVNGNYLDYRIKKKIIGIYDTGYTDEFGLREIVNAAANDLEELDVIKDRRMMQRFLNEVRKDSGLAIYGEDEVKKALEAGAVEVVLISDALEKYKVKARCKNCGYEVKEIVENLDMKCPKCNIPMEILEEKDIVEEYAELAENSGAEIEIIGRESEEGEILYKAFGGIA